jgi:hypothetical protein
MNCGAISISSSQNQSRVEVTLTRIRIIKKTAVKLISTSWEYIIILIAREKSREDGIRIL